MRTIALVATAAALVSPVALADSRPAVVTPPAYQEECGSCHIAYPARFLGPSAWHRVMQGLGRHFGTDATVSPELAREIGAFLEANAGRKERNASPRTARITETEWFRHKHDEVAPAAFRRPAVKSAANCGACHTRAAEGSFREREIRVPR
jgi:hypothetical protein